MVSGQAAADIVHLLAELIENATLFSPRENQIQVTAGNSPGGGVLVEVRDEGVGVSASRLAEMNWRLDHPPGVDVSVSRHMGLFAVSRLAARHGIRVRLRAGTPQGLTALVWLPGNLISREQPPTVGMHSRPRIEGAVFADGTAPALGAALGAAHATAPGAGGLRQRAPGRRGGGRHRLSLLASNGDQPAVGDGPELRSAWFVAKTPSGRSPSNASPASPASAPAWSAAARWPSSADPSWGPAGVDWAAASAPDAGPHSAGLAAAWPDGGQVTGPTQGRQTRAGLPQRVPRASAAFDGPPPGYDAPVPGALVSDVPALGAPPGAAAGAQQQVTRQTPRRRSPEEARNLLAGFQLGSRDATQAGNSPGWTPYAGEETSR
jgi:hypothetical protein